MSDETEGLTKRAHTRREFLKIAGVAGATVGLGAGLGGLVSACGGTEETTTTAGPATTAGPTTTAAAGATTTTAVAATTTTGMPYAGGKKVLDSFYTLDQVFWQQWDRGAQAACAALGLEHIRLVDNSDVNVQISGFENAPTQEINMAVSIAWSQASSAQIGKICQDNRIWWCNVWSNSPWSTPLDIGDYYVTWITASDEIAGYTVAKGLFEKVGSAGEFIHIEGQPGNSASDLRNVGVDKALAEFPNIKMVARQPGNFNRSESRAVMDDLLIAHPDVKCAMGQNDDAAIGVWNSCEAAGKTTVAVGGIDGIPEMIDLVEQGKTAMTIAVHPPWEAGYLIVTAYDAANGWKPTTPERMMYWGGVLLNTKEKAATYNQAVYKGAEIGFDWKLMSRVLNPDTWDPQCLLYPIDPEVIWKSAEKPAGYQTPQAYADSKSTGEWDKITQLYKDHFKSGPLFELLK